MILIFSPALQSISLIINTPILIPAAVNPLPPFITYIII